jgi:imidazolonepropionase-like amidohydrolase
MDRSTMTNAFAVAVRAIPILLAQVACGSSSLSLESPVKRTGKGADVSTSSITAIVGATIWQGTGVKPLENGILLVNDGRIDQVARADEIEVPAGARVIDANGTWIIPGLVDAHVHFFQSGGIHTRPDAVDVRIARSYEAEVSAIKRDLSSTLKRYLALGVTAVVDLGGPMWNFDVRKEANERRLAPRVAVAGPLISTVARPELDVGDPPIIQVSTEDDTRAAVKRQTQKKPDFVKFWFIEDQTIAFEKMVTLMRAAAEEARTAGVRFAVHATTLDGARAAVDAGASTLVHSVTSELVDDDFIHAVVNRGVIVIPTLVVERGYARVLSGNWDLTKLQRRYGSPTAIASWLEATHLGLPRADMLADNGRRFIAQVDRRSEIAAQNLRRLSAAGAIIAAGSDAGNIGTLHGTGLHEELAAMHEAGLSNEDVLRAATRNAAKVFAAEPDIGTLERGKRADFLIIEGNPLHDLAHLQHIRHVVKDGELLVPPEILPQNPQSVVDGYVDALNAQDLEDMRHYLADDVTVRTLEGAEVTCGADAVIENHRGWRPSVTKEIHSGDFVVQLQEMNDPIRREIWIHKVEDGVITTIWKVPVTEDSTGGADIVQAELDTYSARNPDRLLKFFSNDFTATMLDSQEVVWDGPEAFGASYDALLKMSATFTAVAVTRIEAGPYVIDREMVFGLEGSRRAVRAVAINEVRNGTIQRIFFLPYETW